MIRQPSIQIALLNHRDAIENVSGFLILNFSDWTKIKSKA
jgi:hypothetical protein